MLPKSVVSTVYVLLTKLERRVLLLGPLVRSVLTESSILIQDCCEEDEDTGRKVDRELEEYEPLDVFIE